MLKPSCRSALLLGLLALTGPLRADVPPLLRYTTYLLVEPPAGQAQVRLKSVPYGALHQDYVYKDQPEYAVLDDRGSVVDLLEGKLGQETVLDLPQDAGEFVLLKLQPRHNYVQVDTAAPHALVATAHAPLNCVRGFERHYFYVPRGLSGAAIFFHAVSLREAGRALIYNPDGQVVAELEDDFQQPIPVNFSVPEGQDGKVWSVALVAPRNPDWKLDDCQVWLGASLPGLLAPRADWAERLSRRWAIEWRPVLGFEQARDHFSSQWDRPATGGPEPTYEVKVSPEKPYRGEKSLRVAMTFPEGYNQPQMLKVFTAHFTAGAPRRVSFWLYGDNSGRKLQLRLRDQNQELFYAPPVTINWSGWGEVVADFGGLGVIIAGGDGNKTIDGPQVGLVFQLSHVPGQPLQSVYYIDNVAVSP